MRKRIYIAGPMSRGDRVANLAAALTAYRSLHDLGYAPLCPQLTFFVAELLPSIDWQGWIDADLPWVRAADAMLRLPGESAGADREELAALECGVPVFHSLHELILEMPY